MNNKEKILTENEKNEYKDLLSELSSSIKNAELNQKELNLYEKLTLLSRKIDKLWTKEQAYDFLDEVKNELQPLKEYAEYKKLFGDLERKVEDFEKQVKKHTKVQLSNLENDIIKTNLNLTKEQILSKADEWRKKAKNEMSWIVSMLAKKWWLLWKLAKLANGDQNNKTV